MLGLGFGQEDSKPMYYFQQLTNLGEISYRRLSVSPNADDLDPSAIINEAC